MRSRFDNVVGFVKVIFAVALVYASLETFRTSVS